ncbi:hypothetical protein CLM82_03135, partial [Streptomyces albidoflavus]
MSRAASVVGAVRCQVDLADAWPVAARAADRACPAPSWRRTSAASSSSGGCSGRCAGPRSAGCCATPSTY